MTDPQSAAASPEPTAATQQASDVPLNSGAETTSLNDSTTPVTADGLPEWEPLTPEFVEDEAIRGDFMLRWAAILLSLLLGCRQLVESSVLVHIKTGDYLASHGLWPASKDVFSFSAGDRTWVNLSWLFDLIVSGVHAIAGPAGVSVSVGLLAALTAYWVVNLSRKEVPTWWTALVTGVSLLATQIAFVPLPRMITLVGVVWFLKQLVQWNETRNAKLLWCLVGSLVVWSNLDAHAYVGWVLLAVYGAGTVLGSRFGRSAPLSTNAKKSLGIAVGAGLFALMLNPNGWHALASPLVWYFTTIPTMQSYALRSPEFELQLWFGVFDPIWSSMALHLVPAVVVIVAAFVTSIMNRNKTDVGLLLATIVTALLGVWCLHDLPVAVVVAAVLANLNGQDWYRDHCRQTYSIETREVLYSRAGRAVTVLGFAVVAFAAISGRLMGRDGKRVGLGFGPQVAANISGVARDIEGLNDERIFNVRVELGDYLIWSGQKSFIDSRIELFATGKDSVTADHEALRNALRRPAPNKDAKPAAGEKSDSKNDKSATESDLSPAARMAEIERIFDRYSITSLSPRMWGLVNYALFADLATSPDWRLTRLGSTLALFRPKSRLGNVSMVDFRKDALESCPKPSPTLARTFWPRPKTGYQQFLSLAGSPISNAAQRSRHALQLLSYIQQGALRPQLGQTLGLAIQATRDAQTAISEEPSNVAAYIFLSDAYSVLGSIESQLCASAGLIAPTLMRNQQATSSLQEALVLDPENRLIMASLIGRYAASKQIDSAIELIDLYVQRVREGVFNDDADIRALRQFNEYRTQNEKLIEQVEEKIKKAFEAKSDRLQIAAEVRLEGLPKRALKVLDEDRAYLTGNTQAQLLQASLLFETGRLEEAYTLYEAISDLGAETLQTREPWQVQMAFIATIRGDYDRATLVCRQRLDALERASLEGALMTSPMKMPPPELLRAQALWPFQHIAAASHAVGGSSDEAAALRWIIAVCHLENGRCEEAVKVMQDSIKLDSHSGARVLCSVFLELMTNKPVVSASEDDQVPLLFAE